MSCTLYFIRHGQSIGNLKKTFLGHTDLDLSELGYAQAAKTAQYLNSVQIDTVYSSDLLRAYNTCGEYTKLTGKAVEKKTELREIFAGDWEGCTFTDLQSEFSNTYNVWLNDIGISKPDNGESVRELSERVINCVRQIACDNDGKTVAIFTHATVIRSFFNFAYGNSLDEMKNLKWATNASVSIAEFDGNNFRIIDYSRDDFLNEFKTGFPANI